MTDNLRLRFPYAPGAVRECLLDDDELVHHVPKDHISARDQPKRIQRPFIICRPASTTGRDPLLRKPIVQVDVFVPPRDVLVAGPALIEGDPDEVAWDLAALCGDILTRHKGRKWRSANWTGRWIDGPGSGPSMDVARTEDLPLHRALVRVELTMKLLELPSFVWDRSS